MTLYEYRCEEDGDFDVMRPMGTAPESLPCPVCDGASRRVFSRPSQFTTPRALVAAVDHAEKSRHEPDVVTSLPRRPVHRRTPVAPLTPKLARLPRP
jgi:putative FmdB family regulatory protein